MVRGRWYLYGGEVHHVVPRPVGNLQLVLPGGERAQQLGQDSLADNGVQGEDKLRVNQEVSCPSLSVGDGEIEVECSRQVYRQLCIVRGSVLLCGAVPGQGVVGATVILSSTVRILSKVLHGDATHPSGG